MFVLYARPSVRPRPSSIIPAWLAGWLHAAKKEKGPPAACCLPAPTPLSISTGQGSQHIRIKHFEVYVDKVTSGIVHTVVDKSVHN